MKQLLSCILILVGTTLFAQLQNGKSRSELGINIGGSYYIGDLNQYKHFYKTNLSGGVFYRFNIHSRLSFRVNLHYAKVEAYDSDAKMDVNRNRNLSFFSNIFEVASGVEFTYLPFWLGSKKQYQGTCYLIAEAGGFYMNPKTMYNDEKVELQALGTEGQGTSINSKKHYSKIQFCLPIGAGFKMAFGKRFSMGVEYLIRKTFTDYLDDVGSDSYVDPTLLSIESGPTAAILSNRSLNGDRFGKRGTKSTKDWYSTFGVTLSVRLGNPNKCPLR
ncbi:MAG: DUF6089 family protein [Bacteroidota bacterium]